MSQENHGYPGEQDGQLQDGQQDGQEFAEEPLTGEDLNEAIFEEEALRRRGLMTGEADGSDGSTQDGSGAAVDGAAGQAPAAPVSQQQVAPQSSSGQQVSQQTPEWWDSLPPDAQKQFQDTRSELVRVNQMYSALHGRLAPVQQDNARLARQLQTLQQQTRPAGNSGNGSQSPRVDTATLAAATSAEDLRSAEFTEFSKTFPEEARVIEAMVQAKTGQIESLVQRVGDLSTQLESIQQATLRQTRDTELFRLSEAHPDWAAVRTSEDFNLWISTQPSAVQQLVESSRADDCIWLIDSYKANNYIRQTLASQQGGQQNGSTSAGRNSNPSVQEATATRARRQAVRRIATPEPQGGQVGMPRGQANMSDEDIWAAEVERRSRAYSQQTR